MSAGRTRSRVTALSADDIVDLLIEETGAIGRLLEMQRPNIPD